MIICKKYKYVILPSQIDSYFTPLYLYGFVKQAQERIIKEVAKVDRLILDNKVLK